MQLLQNGKQQWIDQNGLPLANGTVGFYAPGTLNPQATYQDQGGTIQNTNPITLDSRGQAIVWGTGTYRQIVKDASGVTIWDQIVDTPTGGASLSNTAGAGGAALVGFDGGTVADFFKSKNNRVVDSIAALRTLSKTLYTRAFVTGYYAIGDGGGGPYQYDPADTTSADNGGTIIVASDGGRWKLQKVDWISCRQFGAKGDSTTDDTTALQAWLNIGGNLWAPAGNYKITAALKWAIDNTWIQGAGRSLTIFNFNFSGPSALLSSTQGTTQRLYCRASDIQFLDNGGVSRIVDLKDMMFCYLERCFTFGKGAASSIGIYMASTNTTLQCTYNVLRDHYNGNTQYGVYMTDGANANLIEGGRFQSPVSGAIGILLTATALNNVNGNTILGVGIEQPSNTLIGIQCNGNTSGTTIISPRLEQLSTGIVIQSTDIGVTVVNPYYDSCTTNITDLSTQKAVQLGLGKVVGRTTAPVSFNFNGPGNTTNAAVGCVISRVATGQYQITISPAFANANFKIGISSSQPMCTTQIISASTVNVLTYNASGVAADSVISGAMWD